MTLSRGSDLTSLSSFHIWKLRSVTCFMVSFSTLQLFWCCWYSRTDNSLSLFSLSFQQDVILRTNVWIPSPVQKHGVNTQVNFYLACSIQIVKIIFLCLKNPTNQFYQSIPFQIDKRIFVCLMKTFFLLEFSLPINPVSRINCSPCPS